MGSLSLTSIFPHSLSTVYLAVYNQTCLKNGYLVLDSWPVSCDCDRNWKWIYHFPCLQNSAASDQNQRIFRFTCCGKFLCWAECCSLTFCLREDTSVTNVTNLYSLVLDRYIAVVKPLKYLLFMTRKRVSQLIFFLRYCQFLLCPDVLTWLVFIVNISVFVINSWIIMIIFEILPCCGLIFSFGSMLHVVYGHERAACISKTRRRRL